jgi:DUF4097 and DUF4098 domain-containing protein YvlB
MSPLVKRLLIGGGLFVVLAAGALAVLNFGFDKTSVRNHSVAGKVSAIVVKSDSGNVDLVPAHARIAVRETRHYVFDEPAFTQHVAGGVLTLESDCRASVVRCYADLRVAVPAGVGVTVEADSGDVAAHGIDVRGAHVQTDSGDLELDLAGHPRAVWAHTDSGDVTVSVPRGTYAVDTATDSGDENVDGVTVYDDAPRSIEAHTDSGNVDVQGR